MHTHDTTPRGTRDTGTEVACACGAALFTLAPDEGIYPRGVLLRTLADSTTQRKGACQRCGAAYTIPVSQWSSQ